MKKLYIFLLLSVVLLFLCCATIKPTKTQVIVLEELQKEEDVLQEEQEVIIQKANWFDKEIENSVKRVSKKYNIPEYVLYAIIATESGKYTLAEISHETICNVNSKAKSNANCYGLMQVSKYALNDYNKYNKTNYTMEALYNTNVNIEIGTWYFSQFRTVSKNYIEQYVIYNVGYGEFNKVNKKSFYNEEGKWESNYRNSFFYMNNLYPPRDNSHGVYGKNSLPKYNGKKRFEACLNVCKEKTLNGLGV